MDPTTLRSTPKRLEQKVDMEFVARGLSEILRFNQAVSGIKFVFREKDVQGAQLDLESKGVPLGLLLHEGLSRRGFRFFVRPDGKIAVMPWAPSSGGLKNE